MSVPLPDRPTCGHNTSAFAGSCTAIVIGDDGWPSGYCGHDCSVDYFGESIWDRFQRHMWGPREDQPDEPLPHPGSES